MLTLIIYSFPDVENDLYQWLTTQQITSITRSELGEKAREFAKARDKRRFKCSSYWIAAFISRYFPRGSLLVLINHNGKNDISPLHSNKNRININHPPRSENFLSNGKIFPTDRKNKMTDSTFMQKHKTLPSLTLPAWIL